jgi:transposase InsO family protein
MSSSVSRNAGGRDARWNRGWRICGITVCCSPCRHFSILTKGYPLNIETTRFVTDALVMAIWRRGKPDALLHHSDRGSQYTSEQFQRLMAGCQSASKFDPRSGVRP